MESHHPTTAEVKNLLGFSEIVVLLPFFGGDEVFLVITHLEFKPNTVPFRWALSSAQGAMIRGVWGRRSFGSGAAVSEGWKLGRFTKCKSRHAILN